jgi:N-acetylglutamate synthase-like GNAT family acetyltransferase
VIQFAVRAASLDDAKALAELFAAVAEERDWIATEPPVDIDTRAAQFASTTASLVVAEADSQIIGMLYLEVSCHGFGEINMHVGRDWRGCGVGSALIQAAFGLADKHGLHKLSRDPGLIKEAREQGRLWDIDTGHDLMLTEPALVTEVLLDIAAAPVKSDATRQDGG